LDASPTRIMSLTSVSPFQTICLFHDNRALYDSQ